MSRLSKFFGVLFLLGALFIGVQTSSAATCTGTNVGGTGLCYPNVFTQGQLLQTTNGGLATTSAASSGQILQYNGTIWAPANVSSLGAASSTLLSDSNTFSGATTTITNVSTTWWDGVANALGFSGANIGAKINSAANSATTTTIIRTPAGQTFNYSTDIVLNTANKNITLDCQGSTLNYTGSGIGFTSDSVTVHHTFPAFQNCYFAGPNRAGSTVGIKMAGTNGAEGASIVNSTITGFGTAFTFGTNGYLITLDHVTIINNGKNFLAPAGLSNAGENINIVSSNISNDFSPSPSPYHIACFDIESTNPVTINILNTSMDNCQIAANASTTLANLHLTNVYMESPGQNSYTPAVPFITIATTTVGTATNIVTMTGGDFLSVGSTNKPSSYVYVGQSSRFEGFGVEAKVGPAQINNFIEGLGDVSCFSCTNNLFYNGSTNVPAVAAFSPYSPFGNNIQASNGTNIFSVGTNGSISIGTSSQQSAITLQSSTYPQITIANNGTGGGIFRIGDTSNTNGAGGGKLGINFNTTGSTAALLTLVGSSGNFGIGSTSPFTTLSVQGNGYFSGDINVANLTATGTISGASFASSIGGAMIINGGALITASTTIGNGTRTGGLTISGTATSSGAYPQFVYDNPNAGGGTWRCGVGATVNAIGGNNFGCSPTEGSGGTVLLLTADYKAGLASTSPFAQLSIHANSGQTFYTLFAIGSSTASATTTLFTINNTGSIFTTIPTGCVNSTSGVLGSTLCGSAFPFTPTSNFAVNTSATSTPIWARAGIFASSTSQYDWEKSNRIFLNASSSLEYQAGSFGYDSNTQSPVFFNNDSNVALDIGQESWIRVVNNSGATIQNGQAVYITGTSGGTPTISLAQANSVTTSQVIGLTTESIANSGTGFVTQAGIVNGTSTLAYSNGATLYLSADVAGHVTATAPSSPNFRVRVGIVTNSNANGSILVNMSGVGAAPGTAGTAAYFGSNGYTLGAATTTLVAGTGVAFSGGTPIIFGSSPVTINGSTFPFTPINATSVSTSSGLVIVASSTIGNGTTGGGLTISGNGTTTGVTILKGNVGMGGSIVIPAVALEIDPTLSSTGVPQNVLHITHSSIGSAVGDGACETWADNTLRICSYAQSGFKLDFYSNSLPRVRIETAGNFDIGTTSSSAKLAVHGQNGDTNANLFLVASSTQSTTSTVFQITNTGAIFAPFTASSGAAQTGYWCYDANGQLIRDTALCLTSAARFKENINSISNEDALSEALQLQPVSYFYKPSFNGSFQGDPNYSTEQVGFIADAVQQIDPRLVAVETSTTTFEGKTYAPGTVQTFRPDAITAVLAGAIKAQQAEILALGGGAKRSVEDNWQWFAIALLAICVGAQQLQIRKLKK